MKTPEWAMSDAEWDRHVGRDERGWPIRTNHGQRCCARPNCAGGEEREPAHEFRIDGYCSCECQDLHEQEVAVEHLAESVRLAIKSLEGIYEGAGPFNRDPLRHAENCILEMKTQALKALTELRKRIAPYAAPGDGQPENEVSP